MNSHLTKNLKFRIHSMGFTGTFILSFEPEVIYQIEMEVDSFISNRKKKALKDNICIQKIKDGYEITPKSFIAVCNIIFRVIKQYS